METPGPSRVIKTHEMAHSEAACGCALDDRGGMVEFTYCPTHQAAPELLKALEAFYNSRPDFQGPVSVETMARDAINKARDVPRAPYN